MKDKDKDTLIKRKIDIWKFSGFSAGYTAYQEGMNWVNDQWNLVRNFANNKQLFPDIWFKQKTTQQQRQNLIQSFLSNLVREGTISSYLGFSFQIKIQNKNIFVVQGTFPFTDAAIAVINQDTPSLSGNILTNRQMHFQMGRCMKEVRSQIINKYTPDRLCWTHASRAIIFTSNIFKILQRQLEDFKGLKVKREGSIIIFAQQVKQKVQTTLLNVGFTVFSPYYLNERITGKDIEFLAKLSQDWIGQVPYIKLIKSQWQTVLKRYGKEPVPDNINPKVFQQWRKIVQNPILKRSKNNSIQSHRSKSMLSATKLPHTLKELIQTHNQFKKFDEQEKTKKQQKKASGANQGYTRQNTRNDHQKGNYRNKRKDSQVSNNHSNSKKRVSFKEHKKHNDRRSANYQEDNRSRDSSKHTFRKDKGRKNRYDDSD